VGPSEGIKIVATNPNASRHYEFKEFVEAGLLLTGTEIKSIRAHSPNLADSFVEVFLRNGKAEAFLVGAHIAPYSHGNIWNHEPVRRRKLLLHRHQIEKMFGAVQMDGMTIVPTKIYLKKGYAKIELAVAKGRRKGDKRAAHREKTDRRDIRQASQKSKAQKRQ